MPKKTVSVVMATYNGSKYLERQLTSLIEQTVPPDEIIIADDGSSDDSLKIARRLTEGRNLNVKILARAERLGFRENFIAAAKEATGDFIAFCDQDDIWRRDKLELCSRYFHDSAISLIVHSAITIDGSSRRIGTFDQGIVRTRIVPPLSYDPWDTFWGFSIVFRRELLSIYPSQNRFLDYISPAHLIAHDRWIVFLGQIVGATAELNEPLVEYRQHDDNVYGRGSVFGLSTTHDIKGRSAIYTQATAQMVEVARGIRLSSKDVFPLYDRDRSIAFFEAALHQIQSRDRIYESRTVMQALKAIFALVLHRGYASVHNGEMRWKSLVRDLRFAIARS